MSLDKDVLQHLGKISEAIGQPTLLEVLTFGVSAAAAAATIAIAVLNLRLLKQQKELQAKQLEQEISRDAVDARIRRRRFSAELTQLIFAKLGPLAVPTQEKGLVREPTWDEIALVGQEADEPSYNRLFLFVLAAMNGPDLIQQNEASLWATTMNTLIQLVDEWAEDPESALETVDAGLKPNGF